MASGSPDENEEPIFLERTLSARRVAAHEALLMTVFVGDALWVGAELVPAAAASLPNGKAEEGRLPKTFKGGGLVSRRITSSAALSRENVQR